MDSKDLRNLSEAWDNIVSTKEEVEQIDEAPMTAFQAGGGQAKLDQLNKGRSPRAGRVTAAQIERQGQQNLYKAGGGDAAIAKGPTRAQNVRGGGQVKVPTLTRQDIINRGAAAAGSKPKPAAPATPVQQPPAQRSPRQQPPRQQPSAAPAITKSKPEAPKPLGFTPRTLTSAELKAATAARAAARSAGKSAADVEKDAIAAVSKLQKSSFDIFDVIKGHLLDEGYADTEEAALAIMANMSEEWRQSIVEGGFNSSGRYDVGGGRTVGPVAGAVRSLFSGNLPKGQTYVPPTKQTGPNRPPAVPASKDDSGKLTDFGAGGGKKKMQSSGMSVGQVERQGRMNKGDYSS